MNSNPSDDIDRLKPAIIVELHEYRALENIVYQDFHGQKKGKDPQFDKLCQRADEAEEKLYKKIVEYITTQTTKAIEKELDLAEIAVKRGLNFGLYKLERLQSLRKGDK